MHLKSCNVIRPALALAHLILLTLASISHGQDEVVRKALQLMDEGKINEGIHIFEKLADDGDDRSMVQLGVYYFEGAVILQDHSKAMEWWLKALAKDNADAFVNLGVMHRDGKGVPANKKIAYCIFLTTYMNGLGNESTQQRAGDCLSRLMRKISKKDINDCLSNYTLPYLQAYLKAKGDMNGIPEKYQPSDKNPALKNLDWWLDGKLNAIFGPTSVDTDEAHAEKRQPDADERPAAEHTMAYEIRFPTGTETSYDCRQLINGIVTGSAILSPENLKRQDDYLIYENQQNIIGDEHRQITLENKNHVTAVFRIEHPVRPVQADWTPWMKPDFLFDENTEGFNLHNGEEPKLKNIPIPSNTPELRFRVF